MVKFTDTTSGIDGPLPRSLIRPSYQSRARLPRRGVQARDVRTNMPSPKYALRSTKCDAVERHSHLGTHCVKALYETKRYAICEIIQSCRGAYARP